MTEAMDHIIFWRQLVVNHVHLASVPTRFFSMVLVIKTINFGVSARAYEYHPYQTLMYNKMYNKILLKNHH